MINQNAGKTSCKRGHEFTTENTYTDIRGSRHCKECQTAYNQSPKSREARAKFRTSAKGRAYRALWTTGHRKQIRAQTNLGNAELKLEVLSHYSVGGVLGCCWEGCTTTDIDMLTLDHLNDDGYKHIIPGKTQRLSGNAIHIWARVHGFPEGLQTLCANHNLKKRIRKARADRKQ